MSAIGERITNAAEVRARIRAAMPAPVLTPLGPCRSLACAATCSPECAFRETCHCGADAIDPDSEHWPYRRGYCEQCALVRCDAYPGACEP